MAYLPKELLIKPRNPCAVQSMINLLIILSVAAIIAATFYK